MSVCEVISKKRRSPNYLACSVLCSISHKAGYKGKEHHESVLLLFCFVSCFLPKQFYSVLCLDWLFPAA